MSTSKKNAPALMSREEYNSWFGDIPEDVCPFCQRDDYQITLGESLHWSWVMNRAPYWKWHTMFIPKRHVTEISHLSVQEMGELFTVYQVAVDTLQKLHSNLPDEEQSGKFVFFWRFRWDSSKDAHHQKSPDHFHLHLSPDRSGLFDPSLDENAKEIEYFRLQNMAKNAFNKI